MPGLELKKGLVVDDSAVFRDMYARFLTNRGFAVKVADSFRAAHSLLQREFFHVVAVDLSLVGDRNRDGLRLLEFIYKELREGTEAVLLSAYGTMGVGAAAKETGAFAVLEKDEVDPAEFEALSDEAYLKASSKLVKDQIGLDFLAAEPDPHSRVIWTTKVLSLLDAGDFGYVDSFVRRLLLHLNPLLIHSQRPRAQTDSDKRQIVAVYWSKMLGQAVSVYLAQPPAIVEEKDRSEQTMNHAIIKCNVEARLAGLVIRLDAPDRAEFAPFRILT